MTYSESYIRINDSWRILLVVETSELTSFGSSISFKAADYTCVYVIGMPVRVALEDGKYYYWFLPASKELVYTSEKANLFRDAGAKQVQLYCAADNVPTADSGIFVKAFDEWESGKEYKKNDLFAYNGSMGYVKQAHTSQETWLPFAPGTEALYGARPAPDADGVYPYVYNMAADVGMKVRDPDDEQVYECTLAITDMLYKPHEIAAHFKLVTE